MITFEARQQVLKYPDTITRKAHSVYPCLSGSLLITKTKRRALVSSFYWRVANRIKDFRGLMEDTDYSLKSLIEGFKMYKSANCEEYSRLAQLIGIINGQENIYLGAIGFRKKGDKKIKALDHSVAFITDKKMKNIKPQSLKAKEAIVIDPWLGITDYVSEYFTKLATLHREKFTVLNDNKSIQCKADSKKNKVINDEFFITPHFQYFDRSKLLAVKSEYPELIISDYKPVQLNYKK